MSEAGRTRRSLHEGWTARTHDVRAPSPVRESDIPASVPGCVHTDLLAAGLIDDPFLGDNESAQRWIGESDWHYRSTFDWRPDGSERSDLVFEGLDTVADVRLNGVHLLSAANQHRTYRLDMTSALLPGENHLEVSFHSPVRAANLRSLQLGARPRPYPLPYEALRKSASSFGWDWGIATATSGIWRPVFLESWSTARIAELRILAEPTTPGSGRVCAEVLVERTGTTPRELEVEVEIAGVSKTVRVPADRDRLRIEVETSAVERWWPIGYGAQPLYDVTVTLGDDHHVLDRAVRRVGFRTVRWDMTPDADGTPFALVVNDVPVFVKGVNWIPDDALVTRVDENRYRMRLEQARDANVNLVRVWGGGIYESEEFYDICDELGLLTWQDFLFACAAYPEEEPLRGEIHAEAREQIVRLSAHASLMLLCGNNENLMGHRDWGWQRSLDGATWGAHYYFEMFPRLIAELAPWVPYVPGSPFHPGGGDPNDDRHGPVHLWRQWNSEDWRTYSDHTPRFVAEFGWQGPPNWSTLTAAIHDDPLTPESPGMLVHQKAESGNAKLRDGLLAHARIPRTMADWHWAMQWNQAAAMRHAIEHFRASAPLTQGTVVWQLNDCWPVTSWSAIDHSGRRKPAWYALREAYHPRLITVQPRGEALAVILVNDSAEEWAGRLVVRRHHYDGGVRAESVRDFFVPARGTVALPLDGAVGTPDDAASELLIAAIDDDCAHHFFAEPRDSALRPAALRVTVTPSSEGSTVTVTADSVVRDLFLSADRVHPDADVEAGFHTLLAGESTTFPVRHPAGVDEHAIRRALHSVNDLISDGGD